LWCPRNDRGEQRTTHPTFFDAVDAEDPPRQQESVINGLSFAGQIVIAVDSGTQDPALWKAAAMARIHGKPLALVSVTVHSSVTGVGRRPWKIRIHITERI
jgi:hypothetical protein